MLASLFFEPRSFAALQGGMQCMRHLRSGVMQGCPLSGSAWAIAMGPILTPAAEVSSPSPQG
eukprot:7230302-Pyramimonas_sp.AAC.1